MILILSRESAEITTDVVIDWLDHYQIAYFRLNGEDLVNGKCLVDFYIDPAKSKWVFKIIYEDISIHSDTIKAVWFRRSFDWDIETRFWNSTTCIDEYKFLQELNNYHQMEIRTVYNHIERVLDDRYWLSRPSKSGSNKFRTLEIAKQIGFNIPDSIITNNLPGLKKFVNSHKNCITKPSRDGTLIQGNDFGISTMTNAVDKDILATDAKDFFTPSFFQSEIKKDYEIRVIYLENQIFSVGIFSQANEKTKLDYRNYDTKNPNRLQLIDLPKEVLHNIKELMSHLQLNFGSIDIIKDVYGGYYFLEINPVGQFLGISNILGLGIERTIATILKEKYEFKSI